MKYDLGDGEIMWSDMFTRFFGEDSHVDLVLTYFFQMGWFNHLVTLLFHSPG